MVNDLAVLKEYFDQNCLPIEYGGNAQFLNESTLL